MNTHPLFLRRCFLFVIALVGFATTSTQAFLLGTTPTNPGDTVFPGLVPPGTPEGTLLASLVDPFSYSTTAGTTSGTVTTAVFREATGTLDFYYQVMVNAISATEIARLTGVNFAGFATAVGLRIDAVGPFVAGTVTPVTADRNGSGAVVGFSFFPPNSAKIMPGLTSEILVISTNATAFTAGNLSVIDGGSQTLPAFQPTVPVSTPDSGSSFLLLGVGLLGLFGASRVRSLRLA